MYPKKVSWVDSNLFAEISYSSFAAKEITHKKVVLFLYASKHASHCGRRKCAFWMLVAAALPNQRHHSSSVAREDHSFLKSFNPSNTVQHNNINVKTISGEICDESKPFFSPSISCSIPYGSSEYSSPRGVFWEHNALYEGPREHGKQAPRARKMWFIIPRGGTLRGTSLVRRRVCTCLHLWHFQLMSNWNCD